jgi:small subunit ribosomal protein S20
MPNTRSAAKQARSSVRRRGQNASVKSKVKNTDKGIRQLVTSGKKEEAAKKLSEFQSVLDKAVKSKVIHANKAARHKSRIVALLKK